MLLFSEILQFSEVFKNFKLRSTQPVHFNLQQIIDTHAVDLSETFEKYFYFKSLKILRKLYILQNLQQISFLSILPDKPTLQELKRSRNLTTLGADYDSLKRKYQDALMALSQQQKELERSKNEVC